MLFTLLLLRSLLKFPERGRLGGVVQGWCLPGGDSTSILKVGFLRTDVAGAVAVIVAIAVTIGVYTTSVVHVCDVCDAIAASARLLKSSSRYFLTHDGATTTEVTTEVTTTTEEAVVVTAVVIPAVLVTAGIVILAGVVTAANSISACAAAAIAVTIGVYTTSVVHVCDVCDAIAASARLLKSSSRYFLNHDGASDGARTTNKTGTATEATTSTVEVVVVSAVVVTAVVVTSGIVTAGVVTGVNSISTCAAACTAGTAMLNTALIRCW